MKKKLLAILFASIVFTSYAQTEKGTKIIGGTAGFSMSGDKHKVGNTTTDRWKHFNLYLNPNAGIFIMDQLAIGAALNLSSQTSTLKNDLNLGNGQRADRRNNTVSLTLGPWARYYLPVGTSSAAFAEVSTGFGVQRQKYTMVDNGRVITITNPSDRNVQIGIGPGYTYFINKNIGIEALLKYQIHRTSSTQTGSNIREHYTNSGLYLNIGFQIYL